MGRVVTNDLSSYQHLVESIDRFLPQEQLTNLMSEVGLAECSFTNLTDGIAAVHSGYRLD